MDGSSGGASHRDVARAARTHVLREDDGYELRPAGGVAVR